MTKKEKSATSDPMGDIKKLLIMQTLALGFKQKDVAEMLGVSAATMSGLIPRSVGNAARQLARTRTAPEEGAAE